MRDDFDPEFEEGDKLRFRDNLYRVERVDMHASTGGVLQYRLESLEDSPPATLEPRRSQMEEEFCVKEFHSVDVEDIEVVEE